MAATTGPTPKILVVVVPQAVTHGGQALLELGQLGVQAAEVAQELLGELLAGGGDGAGRSEAPRAGRATLLA